MGGNDGSAAPGEGVARGGGSSGPADSRGNGRRRVLVNALSAVIGGGITVATRLAHQMATEHPEIAFLLLCTHEEVAEYGYPGNVEVLRRADLSPRLARWRWEQMEQPTLLEERGIDVVLQLGGYLCFRTKVPQVAVWQNSNVFTPPGIPRPFSEELLVRAQRFVQGRSMRRAEGNVFLTHNSVELCRRYWDMDAIDHTVIHSGVELPEGDPRASAPLSAREPLAVTVGSAYAHKNIEAMIDAMACYADQNEDGLRLEIIGGAPSPDYFASLEARIERLGLGDRVEMVGALPMEAVHERMQRARVYLVTSLLETFGLTLLEAMGNGLPVVASNTTCHPEVGGEAAVYCDPRDPEDVAKKLARVVHDDDLAEQCRERGFERLEAFSWSTSATRYVEAIERAMGGTAR